MGVVNGYGIVTSNEDYMVGGKTGISVWVHQNHVNQRGSQIKKGVQFEAGLKGDVCYVEGG